MCSLLPFILLSLHHQITLASPHQPTSTLIFTHITHSMSLRNAPKSHHNCPFIKVSPITLASPHQLASTPLIFSHITRSMSLRNAPKSHDNYPFDQVITTLIITYYFALFYTAMSLLYFPYPILEICTQISIIIRPSLYIQSTCKFGLNLIHKYTKTAHMQLKYSLI